MTYILFLIIGLILISIGTIIKIKQIKMEILEEMNNQKDIDILNKESEIIENINI